MVWAGQSSEHDADHGEAEEGGDGSGVAFEVAGRAAGSADAGKGALDERKGAPRGAQQVTRTIAVLHVGRVDGDAQQEAQRIDQDVTLAAGDFLPRIKALRVERRA